MPEGIPRDVDKLKKMVDAAVEEFDLAIQFHEAWRPTRSDPELHERMSYCFAGNTFLIVRFALRRELLLSLSRLWDTTKGTVRLSEVGRFLRSEPVVDALAEERHARSTIFPLSVLRNGIAQQADQALCIIDKYDQKGMSETISEKIRKLRNNVLAHRNTNHVHVSGDLPGDVEVEELYQDMATLMAHLLHITRATAYDPRELAEQLKRCAHHFWAGVRGERTEGHPHYRTAPTPLTVAASESAHNSVRDAP